MKLLRLIWLITLVMNTGKSLKIKTILRPCGSKSEQHHVNDILKSCKDELDITLKIVTSLKDSGFSHFLKVESAFEEGRDDEIKLLYKLLLKVESRPASLVYPLKFLKTVNNRAFEAFFHKDNVNNFHGCKDFLTFDTCAEYDKDGVRVPFSEGFCCPCHGNVERYHSRGGQDCGNTDTPIGQEKEPYHSSIHCLRFDQVWYSVNILEKPYIKHDVILHIFREEAVKGGWRWISMSAGQDLLLSTDHTHVATKKGEIIIDYISNLHESLDPLLYKDNVLLIPEPNSEINPANLPLILNGNASEFLVVNKSHVRTDGDTCDKIGVSFEAFMKQQNKCSLPAQSCLGHQPMDFWLHDVERRLTGKDPDYFLSGYATVSDNPVIKNSVGKWFLQLRHPETHIAHIHLKIKADSLQPLYTKKEIYILEVTTGKRGNLTSISVHLYNAGMVATKVQLTLRKCNIYVRVPDPIKQLVTLGPKQSAVKVLTFAAWSIRNNSIICKVSVQGINGARLDERNISFKIGESCSCQINCECWCGVVERHICIPIIGTRYPFLKGPVLHGKRGLDKGVFLCLTVIFGVFMIGIIKAFCGLFEPVCLGQIGWCLITKGKSLDVYYEKELRGFRVMYDKSNTPINPKTGQTVQMMSTRRLFLINLFFGFYLPMIWLHFVILQLRASHRLSHRKTEGVQTTKAEVSLGETFSLSMSDLSRIQKDLTVTTFRRHRKEMQQTTSKASYLNENLPILQSEPVTYTKTKRKHPIPSLENIVKDLLAAKKVYKNFTEEAPNLQNSGNHFSLCGKLIKEGRKYKFEIHNFMKQTFENRGGPRRLARPKPILHPEVFTAHLTSGEVHNVISLQPLYPCLNDIIIEESPHK